MHTKLSKKIYILRMICVGKKPYLKLYRDHVLGLSYIEIISYINKKIVVSKLQFNN